MIPAVDRSAAIRETKVARKELKMKPSVAAAIQRAADATGVDASTFIVSNAYRAALEVERRESQTLLGESDYDAFAAAVDAPGAASPALAELFAHRRAVLGRAVLAGQDDAAGEA